ncbi:c-type cytochrome [Bacteriovorax sp. DB6_IX]|uniref:c-type cytochrome n=1 Tax=Bacteriovorax sp. DB6_IX TaxID=1353530 RepID=UPI000389F2D3|nr:c-type cytochrome [Bacteriovorax sp. DB6_IX]EQC47876.1 cytochrome C [Bacteriovorax sp. DB6_IX]
MSNDNGGKENLILQDDEKHLVLDHDYDGIHELNHPLPSWWTGTWILSFVFCVPYFMYYVMMDGPTLTDEYNTEMAKINKVIEAEVAKSSNFSVEMYNTWVAKNDGVNKGKVVYDENCLSCHMDGGAGDIGPNLTDNYWIHAKGTPETIYPVVVKGVEENGMPAWGEVLSKEDMMAVVSYVMSLKGTNPPNAKEPQGELVE